MVVPTVQFVPGAQTDEVYTAFAQDEIALRPDRWFLTLGAKLLHATYVGWEVQPIARLLWTPDGRQSYWIAATRAVRTPARVDRDLAYTALAAPEESLKAVALTPAPCTPDAAAAPLIEPGLAQRIRAEVSMRSRSAAREGLSTTGRLTTITSRREGRERDLSDALAAVAGGKERAGR